MGSPLFKAAWADWNGQVSPLDSLMIPALDRGFLFGDAVYEVILVSGGRAFLLDQHLERLADNLTALTLDLSSELVAQRIDRLLTTHPLRDGAIYIQVSRGTARRSHLPPADLSPNCLIYTEALDPELSRQRAEKGVQVALLPDGRWQHCCIKSTNLLANVLAHMQAAQAGYDEVVFYDASGRVTEGSRSNVFLVAGHCLKTPPLSQNILPGITRRLVLALGKKLALNVVEAELTPHELTMANEAFLTGTLGGIVPMVAIDGKPLGEGRPGPHTRALAKLYHEQLAAHWG